MSTATAVDATPPRTGKKKLILLIGAALLLLLVLGGGATAWVLKQKAAAEADADAASDEPRPAKVAKREPKAVPAFVPLDMFTVNLADRDAERYAQIGMTLEVEDPKLVDQIKAFMPAIRNNILMTIADKTAVQLMDRDGKRQLALEVRRETSRALGYEPGDAAAQGDARKAGRKPKDPDAALPVRAVHFSNFIIQ
jgi:flagellar protein FliL